MRAELLVTALCKHFENSGGNPIAGEDKWDLQCIRDVLGPQAKQPSVKESDLSLITVSEVNAFTAARPRAWRRVSAPIIMLRQWRLTTTNVT